MNARETFACMVFVAVLVAGARLGQASPRARPVPSHAAKKAAPSPSPALPIQALSSRPAYVYHVAPLLARLGCSLARCHGTATGRGGLHLSLFGAEPDSDYDAIVKGAQGARLRKGDPSRTLFMLKVTGQVAHGGGRRVTPQSPEYRMLATWIAQGAPLADEPRVGLGALRASTESLDIGAGRPQKIRILATFTDGSTRDVTALASYRTLDPTVATVDTWARITPRGSGQTYLVASYCRRSVVVRVISPQRLAAPFPAPRTELSQVDALWLDHLRELGIAPSDPCGDETFIRRAYLDVIGTLPTPAEVRAFVADGRPDRRRRLVDRLLERDEFADYQALKWGDLLRIKSEYPVRLWPKAAQAYHRWVREAIATNRPYDRFARELLTATGSAFRSGEANYYRAVPTREPQAFAETSALLFMGTRLSCTRCHADPYGTWTLQDNLGLAAAFCQVRFKNTGEWKEEVVCLDTALTYRPARGRPPVKPKFPGGAAMDLGPDEDARQRLAAWLVTQRNPWFARNAVNRIWSWLLGKGLVEEVDDMRPTNPPSNPRLLDHLAKELVDHRFDMRHIYRLVLNSRAYQASSDPTPSNGTDSTHFSHYLARRLPAEVLLDAISQVSGSAETFSSQIPEPYTRMVDFRAIALPDGSVGNPFLALFGRPPRDTAYACDRSSRVSPQQVLYLAESADLERKIAGGWRVARLVKDRRTDAEIVDELYLVALARLPTTHEREQLCRLLQGRQPRQQAVADLMWAIFNSREFLFNH